MKQIKINIWRVFRMMWWLLNAWRFKKLGIMSFINSPLRIDGAKNIEIGSSVIIDYKTWLGALPLTGSEDCILQIQDGCNIGNFNHIYATRKIILEKNVLTADKVYISDNLHDYRDIRLPVMKQPIIQNREVRIGEGSWLGENVCVLGVKIGKNCVVGANSVVTRDVPDYCVVVGIPAKIIKRYCTKTDSWKKTDSDGNLLIEPIK